MDYTQASVFGFVYTLTLTISKHHEGPLFFWNHFRCHCRFTFYAGPRSKNAVWKTQLGTERRLHCFGAYSHLHGMGGPETTTMIFVLFHVC